MELKSEFVNAFELFLLLSLLLWSFTWNSSTYLDFSRTGDDGTRNSPKESAGREEERRAAVRTDAFPEVGGEPPLIPPFDEWKGREMTKHGGVSPRKDAHPTPNGPNPAGRKLNYASSKCGAKVLASNAEARYRWAVLNEKPDDYTLSPCRAKRWFVVELCETVEAIQFEMGNYELYSSSPREFSVFWSEVYPPAPEWHLLGHFEAKDQRTMQTFDLRTRNLGKFIKVAVHNHHGREHYCPLSVIRVLGFSVAHKLEDIEAPEKEDGADPDPDLDADFHKKPVKEESMSGGGHSERLPTNIGALLSSHCAGLREETTNVHEPSTAHEPKCRFLVSTFGTEILRQRYSSAKRPDLRGDPPNQFADETGRSDDSGSNSLEIPEPEKKRPFHFPEDVGRGVERNSAQRRIAKEEERGGGAANASQQNAVESAGLVHADSVLFRLTARLKASERDLGLVHKYLQELSQSYRERVARARDLFDRALNAIDVQSRNSKTLDKKQDESINVLERRTKELSLKIDFLMSGRRDLPKKVAELHVFFLVLELILLSTVFTLFVSRFLRKRGDRMAANSFAAMD